MTKTDFLGTLSGERSDKVPFFIRDMTLGMDVLGIRTTDVFGDSFDAARSADCITAFQMMTGQDAVIGCTHSAAFLIEQFGGTMRYPEYGIPVPLDHPLEGARDFSGFDPCPKGMMLGALESYGLVRERLPDTAVVLNVTGPLTKAGVIAGIEYISMLMESERDVMDGLLALCMDNLSEVADAIAGEDSADAALLASATDNPDLFGIERFREFSLPWVKRYTDLLHKKGFPVVFHPHGTFVSVDTDLSADIVGTGCDGFHFPENNDPALLRERFGRRLCLLGGIDIVPHLLEGPERRIREETERYLDVFSGTDYVFMPSCSLHRGVPLENIRAMCSALDK